MEAGLFDDMQIDHGRANIAVAHYVLEGANVTAAAEGFGGEGVAKRMAGGLLRDPAPPNGPLHLPLYRGRVERMASGPAGRRIRVNSGPGEEVLNPERGRRRGPSDEERPVAEPIRVRRPGLSCEAR